MAQETKQGDVKQLDWSRLRSISRSLFELDSVPLLSHTLEFPWEKCSAEISKVLGISLLMQPGELLWKEEGQVIGDIKAPCRLSTIHIQNIDPHCYLCINEQDVLAIMSSLLATDCTTQTLPDGFLDAFYQFLIAQCSLIINETEYGKKIPFKIMDAGQPLQGPALCQDIWVTASERKFLIRLVMPKNFQEAFAAFSLQSFPCSRALQFDQIPIVLRAEAGRSYMSFKQWQAVQPGDFLQIDQLLYEPGADKAKCVLSFNGTPLFRCMVKDDGFKILEIPSHNEVYEPMADQLKTGQQHGAPHHDDEESTFSESEFSEINESTEHEIDEEAEIAPPVAPKQKPIKQPAAQTVENSSLTDIPVTVVIELAHIEMSVQKVVELQPGNMINIGTLPQNTVHLSINNRVVGRGELITLGDALGVRILQMGPDAS